MNKDLISVIIPIYKVERYLHECVDSVIRQTYENLEIILVDDGSPDLCGKICDEYARNDSRVKVIHKENGGLSSARNAGLDVAMGEYIGFIDSDDYICSTMYERLYKSIKEKEADLAACEFVLVNEKNGIISEDIQFKNEVINDDRKFEYMFSKYHFIIACNKLYKRTIFDGLRYKNGKIHEDEYIIHYIIDKSSSIVTIEDKLYFYRKRADSITGNGYNIKSLDSIEAFYDRYLFLNSRNKKLDMCVKYMINLYCNVMGNVNISNKCDKNRYKEIEKMIKKLIKEDKSYKINSCDFIKLYFPRSAQKLVRVKRLLKGFINEN